MQCVPRRDHAPYGLAKKMHLVQGQAYGEEFGFNSFYLLPTNLSRPGDNFETRTSHVIPAMIKKFIAACDVGVDNVELWGDGSPTREFLYLTDAARAIVDATVRYSAGEPINVGFSVEISVKDLARKIAELVGFHGELEWDTAKPNRQPRRKLDVSRARAHIGFVSTTDCDAELGQTIRWYEAYRGSLAEDR